MCIFPGSVYTLMLLISMGLEIIARDTRPPDFQRGFPSEILNHLAPGWALQFYIALNRAVYSLTP